MSGKTSKKRLQMANMENGNHDVENTNTESETNGTSSDNNEELKGFTEADVNNTAIGVIKEVTVVLTRSTPIREIENLQEESSTCSQKKENDEVVEVVETNEETEKRVTRSQKKEHEETVVEVETLAEEEGEKRITRSQTKEEVETNEIETPKQNGDSETKEEGEDLEPDETEPELQFDENSDRDSPASRCLTRRSHVRNMPTPKTPKLFQESEALTPTPEEVDLSQSDNLSTEAVAGNDTTRANFTVHEEQQPSEFLKSLKDKSLSETLRSISSRRSVHSRHITRSDLHFPYPKRASVESISGLKRKHRTPSPEDNKRVKRDSGGLLSYIKSPVFGVRHHFSKDLPSSTPKLTGFRNKNSLLDSEEISKIKLEVEDAQPEKKWCSIM